MATKKRKPAKRKTASKKASKKRSSAPAIGSVTKHLKGLTAAKKKAVVKAVRSFATKACRVKSK